MSKYEITEPDEFIPESNYYLINGVKYWRVTRIKSIINKPGLNTWRARSDYNKTQQYLKERADFGSKAHKLFELKCLGKTVNADNYEEQELKDDLAIFDTVLDKCKLKAILTEQHLWDEFEINGEIIRVAGTADYIGKYTSYQEFLPTVGRGKNKTSVDAKFTKESFVIGDWKTSPGIYGDFWLQLATYAIMYEHLTGIKVDGAFILQMRPDGKGRDFIIEEKTREELQKYFELMLHCVPLFAAQQNGDL